MTATWVALIACSRIISNQQYIPCSLYQTCLVRDTASPGEQKSWISNLREHTQTHTRETVSKMILLVTGLAKGVFHQQSMWSIGVMECELT